MRHYTHNLPLLCCILFFAACQTAPPDVADMVILNANIITLEQEPAKAEALAIKGDTIYQIGTNADLKKLIGDSTQVLDVIGNTVIPGFIEGHGHFMGLGKQQMILAADEAKNWEELVEMVKQEVAQTPKGDWIEGRGWHQEKWDKPLKKSVHGYPLHEALSAVSPDHPVLLRHASGHALLANAKATEIAGVTQATPDPSGGKILKDEQGNPTGVFEENAELLITDAFQEYLDNQTPEAQAERQQKIAQLAMQEALQNGVTTFHDAGTPLKTIRYYEQLAKVGNLHLRLYTMLWEEDFKSLQASVVALPIHTDDHFLTVRAIKQSIDGALGSRGAWLLEEYTDNPGHFGQNTLDPFELQQVAEICFQKDLQLCVHAIGDRANRETLNIFEKAFKDHQAEAKQSQARWRIEHAQHLHPDDIPRFQQLGVIASVQGIHCTSDAPFVLKRLGRKRATEGAYVWRSLLDAGAVVTNGTDTPVEDISPLACFYASVTRKRTDDGTTFFPNQKMTRLEALRSYTIQNASSAFEEDIKGSIKVGKLADLTILSKDILMVSDAELLNTEVVYTIVGGQIKYQKP